MVGHEYDALRNLEARFTRLEGKQTDMGQDLFSLKESVDSNTRALSEYIELSQKLKVGLGILGTIERVTVWVTKVAGGMAIVWASWKYAISQAIISAGK